MPTPDYDASSDMAASILPDRLSLPVRGAHPGASLSQQETTPRREAQVGSALCGSRARKNFSECERFGPASRMCEFGAWDTGLPTLLYALNVLQARAAGATIEEAHEIAGGAL